MSGPFDVAAVRASRMVVRIVEHQLFVGVGGAIDERSRVGACTGQLLIGGDAGQGTNAVGREGR